MFENLISVLGHRAEDVKAGDAAELARHKKALEPDKKRLLTASENLKAATSTARECLFSLAQIEWPSGPPQQILQKSNELNDFLFAAGESMKNAFASINALTLADFTAHAGIERH